MDISGTGSAESRKEVMAKILRFKTKKAAVAFFSEKIATEDKWVVGALRTLANYQTDEEKAMRVTLDHNNAGFQPRHARFCTTAAAYPSVYPGTLEKLRKILPHYCGQLVEHCRAKGTVIIERKTRSDKEA